MKKIFGVLFVLLGLGILLLEQNILYKLFYSLWGPSFSFIDRLLNFAFYSPIWIIPIVLIWIGINFFRDQDTRISGIFLGIMVCILIAIVFIFAYTMANA